MRLLLIISLFFIASASQFAHAKPLAINCQQTQITDLVLAATVLDVENNEPLAFASIGVIGKGKGTITNAAGQFSLRLPVAFKSDTLLISMLGYESLGLPIANLVENVTIKLKPQPVQLAAVEISEKRITAEHIFRQIKANVLKNYPVSSYVMECFYREIKKEDEKYRSLLEAALLIHDKGYDKQQTRETAYIREIRGSSKFTNKFSDFWQRDNLLMATLGLNAVRHPSSTPDIFGKDKYVIKTTTKLRDRETYVLESEMKADDNWQRTLYIDVETFAVHRSEERIQNFGLSWKVENNDSVSMRLTSGTSVFEFREFNGKLYLEHIRHEVENEYFNPKDNKVLSHFTIINHLVINDILEDSGKMIKSLKKVDNHALEMQLTPYNKSFWNSYNLIRQTPLEETVLKDLTHEDGSIQFRQSAKD